MYNFRSLTYNLRACCVAREIRADQKRKSTSRRSINKGGPSARIDDLREKIKIRDQPERTEVPRKAEKRAQAINKAKNELETQGIEARKGEKARLNKQRANFHHLMICFQIVPS